MLDRPHPAHRLLLVGLVGVAEGRVVGLHDQHLRAAVDDVPDQVVVDDLEADDVADVDPGDVQVAGRVAGQEGAAHQVDLVGEDPEERPVRHVLAERQRVPLGVGLRPAR